MYYSSYFGGSGDDIPTAAAVNMDYQLVVVGETQSGDLPILHEYYDGSGESMSFTSQYFIPLFTILYSINLPYLSFTHTKSFIIFFHYVQIYGDS